MRVVARAILRLRNASIAIVLVSFGLLAASRLLTLESVLADRLFLLGGFGCGMGLLMPCVGLLLRCPSCRRRLFAAPVARLIQYPFGTGCPSCGVTFVPASAFDPARGAE